MRFARRGFALYTAIMIGMLITGVVAALTVGLVSDVRRTATLRDDAQMTQLLLAGIRLTEAKLNENALQHGQILESPVPLEGAGVTIKGDLVATTAADVTVSARLAGKTRTQRLHLEPKEGRWRAVSAEMEP